MAAAKEKAALTRAQVDRLLENAKSRALTQPVRLCNWVHESVRAAKGAIKGNIDLVGFYWVGLYGTICDIKNDLVENHEGLLPYVLRWPERREKTIVRLAVLKARIDAIDRILAAFPDPDERILIQFMRNIHSHPLLDNYAVDVRNGKLKGQLKHSLIDKVLTVEETDAAVDRVFRRYGHLILRGTNVEPLIARDFAEASLAAQEALAAAWPAPDRVNV